ncbi:MAG TPA: hypothetical protein P5534_13180 [Candidatus Paceibacterota bacterium]|nr:hypothetical protein [Candidatus Paceibacterota bacterium]
MKPSSAAAPITTYKQGEAILCLTKTNSVLIALSQPEFGAGQPPAVFVLVANTSPRPFVLGPASVRVLGDGKPVRIYTYEDLKRGIEKEASREAFRAVMAAVGDSMSASSPTVSTTSGNYSMYGSSGWTAHGNFSANTHTYDPAAQAAARAAIDQRTDNWLARIAANKATQVNSLDWILRENTLQPGTYAGGLVKLHPEDLKNVRVVLFTVQAGEEAHEFPLEVSK